MEFRRRRFVVFPQSKVRRDTVRYGAARCDGSDLSEDVLGVQHMFTVLGSL